MKAAILFVLGFILGACGQSYQPPTAPSIPALAQDLAAKTVALARLREDGTAKAYCSGVWVGDASILTAAHCLPDDEEGQTPEPQYVVGEDVLDGTQTRTPVTARAVWVEKVDAGHDLALLRAKPPVPIHRVARVALNSIVPGAKAYTMGHPLGLWWSLSSGEIAAVRSIDLEPEIVYVQTTAPTSRGNSGCGLFDEQGGLMGIAHAGLPAGMNLSFYIHGQYIDALIRAAH